MNPAIQLDDLTVCYNRHPAVHHLSGAFHRGSLTAIVGPNGAGKSTLIKAIMGLLPVTTGRIEHAAVAPAEIAYLPQQAQIDRSFPITVLDVVLLGHWQHIGMLGAVTATLRSQAMEALAAVELVDFQRRPIRSLSAGQFQRVLFARMLLQDARLILLDEPFTAIDARTTADLLNVVRAWHDQQRRLLS
jgi:zinc/manganese transport system ATP-binding protein